MRIVLDAGYRGLLRYRAWPAGCRVGRHNEGEKASPRNGTTNLPERIQNSDRQAGWHRLFDLSKDAQR